MLNVIGTRLATPPLLFAPSLACGIVPRCPAGGVCGGDGAVSVRGRLPCNLLPNGYMSASPDKTRASTAPGLPVRRGSVQPRHRAPGERGRARVPTPGMTCVARPCDKGLLLCVQARALTPCRLPLESKLCRHCGRQRRCPLARARAMTGPGLQMHLCVPLFVLLPPAPLLTPVRTHRHISCFSMRCVLKPQGL